jgi:hypothetical protein
MKFQALLDIIINKFHIVLGTLCQGAIIFYHFRTGHDVGPGVVNTVYAFYGFLAGHALTYQKWPDKEPDAPSQ